MLNNVLFYIQKFNEWKDLFEQIKQAANTVKEVVSPDCDYTSALRQANNKLSDYLEQLEKTQKDPSILGVSPELLVRMNIILELHHKANSVSAKNIIENAEKIHNYAYECIVILASYIKAAESKQPINWERFDSIIKKELEKDILKAAQDDAAKKQVRAIIRKAKLAYFPWPQHLLTLFIGVVLGNIISFSNRGISSFETAVVTSFQNIAVYGNALVSMLFYILPFSHTAELSACKDVFTISTLITQIFTVRTLWLRPNQSNFARFFRALLTVFAFPWCAFVGTKLLIKWNFTKGWLIAAILILNVCLGLFFGSMGKKAVNS